MLHISARRPLAPTRSVLAVLLCVSLGVLLLGCSSGEKKATPRAAPTPIAELDTTAMNLPRIEFCAVVAQGAISAALGGKPDTKAAYGNGDEEEVTGVGKDVVHEIGCSWGTDEGTSASAWVFARPVDARFARATIAAGRRTTGCRTAPGPGFGNPSATQSCRLPDGRLRIRHSGLFGQTWLTCELAAKNVEKNALRARTDRWCVEVANALDTSQ